MNLQDYICNIIFNVDGEVRVRRMRNALSQVSQEERELAQAQREEERAAKEAARAQKEHEEKLKKLQEQVKQNCLSFKALPLVSMKAF
ncbi:hypothetical protein ACFOPX_04740 [Helicobacter baculiformis]|uniref:Uncharacterized protein n=1 Tax=Helicobacter baculiformis TaxID=427351 RepID=A0ABV7ZHR9_9HELI|nr:hypothetical protein [Helicobacter baculiformis]